MFIDVQTMNLGAGGGGGGGLNLHTLIGLVYISHEMNFFFFFF